jgi:hypothetical protein
LTQEVLVRLRLALVLSKQPPLFFGSGIGHPSRGLSHSPFFCSSSIVALFVPCCLSFRSLSRFSGLIPFVLLVAVVR